MKSEIFGSANWEQTDMESIFKGFEKSSKAKIEVSVQLSSSRSKTVQTHIRVTY